MSSKNPSSERRKEPPVLAPTHGCAPSLRTTSAAAGTTSGGRCCQKCEGFTW